VHRTGVHVQVGIDLDRTDLQSLRLQEDANGRSADALPEARQNATRDDDIFHVKSRDWTIQRVRDKLCVKISRRAPEGHERPVNPLTDCRLIGFVTPWNRHGTKVSRSGLRPRTSPCLEWTERRIPSVRSRTNRFSSSPSGATIVPTCKRGKTARSRSRRNSPEKASSSS